MIWGVQATVVTPSAAAISAIARAVSTSGAPSSRPGSMWQCRSINRASSDQCAWNVSRGKAPITRATMIVRRLFGYNMAADGIEAFR
jgi:hypothetical protein